jgi:hypothetical protein
MGMNLGGGSMVVSEKRKAWYSSDFAYGNKSA